VIEFYIPKEKPSMAKKEFDIMYWADPSFSKEITMTDDEFNIIVEIGKDMGLKILPALTPQEQDKLMDLEENHSQVLFGIYESDYNINILTTIDIPVPEQGKLIKSFFKRVNEHFETIKKE